jgi:hypothetical protein
MVVVMGEVPDLAHLFWIRLSESRAPDGSALFRPDRGVFV